MKIVIQCWFTILKLFEYICQTQIRQRLHAEWISCVSLFFWVTYNSHSLKILFLEQLTFYDDICELNWLIILVKQLKTYFKIRFYRQMNAIACVVLITLLKLVLMNKTNSGGIDICDLFCTLLVVLITNTCLQIVAHEFQQFYSKNVFR